MATKILAKLLPTFVLVIAALALTGCAVPNRSLSKEAITQLGGVQGVLSVPQNNLHVVVQPVSSYSAFPHRRDRLRMEMIDAIRQADAERIAEPMLVTLRDYDFAKALQSESKAAFDNVKNIKLAVPLKVQAIVSESAKRIAVDEAAGDAVLFCEVFYSLHHRDLVVTLVATMHPKNDKLKSYRIKPDDKYPLAEGNAIYKQVFSFTKQYVSAETIKADLLEGGRNVMKQLAADINQGI